MKRIVLIGGGALLVLLVAAAVALPSLIDIEKHRPAIERALSSATGRAVTLGPMRLRVLPWPSLSAAGITVGDDPDFGPDPFLEAGHLEVSVRLLPLVAGRVAVDSLTIDAPRLRLVRDGRKGWNLTSLMGGGARAGAGAPAPGGAAGPLRGGASPPEAGAVPPGDARGEESGGTTSGGSGAVSLSVARLRLSKGAVTFVDGALVKGHSLTTEAREIDLTVTDLSATSSVGVDLAFELAGAGSARLRGRVGPPPAAGTPSGWPIDARLELLDFKGGPAAAYLESFTGVRIRGGSLDLDVTVKGTAPGRFAVAGEASLRALEMNPLAGGGRPVRLDASVNLDATFAAEETRLSRCDVKVGGSSLSVTGVLTGLPDRPAIDARVVSKKVALADIAQVLDLMGPFLPRGLARKGEIALDANARGSLADPLKMSVEGRAEIWGLEYADPALKRPVTEIGGTLALRGATAEIKGFTASLGRSRVTGECVMTRSARPVLDVHLASPLIDLDEVLSLMTTAAPEEAALADGGGGIVVAALGEVEAGQGRPHVIAARRESAPAAPATSILRDVTVRGDVTVERAKIMNLQIEAARADISMERGEARLNGVGLRLYKGGMTGEVAAVLTDPGPPFTLSAALQGVDFNAMASDLSADLRNLIRGTLEAGLDVQGRGLATNDLRRQLTGRGRLALRDGKVASFSVLKGLAKALKAAGGRGIGEDETPFTSLTGTFEIGKGLARTEDLALDSPEIDMRGEGSVGLDLTLDLDLAARISQGVSAGMVAKTPALRYLEDKKGRLALDFRLGGTLMEPAVGIDPEMLKRAARSAAKEEIKGKKKDLLRKLLEKD